MYINRHAVLMIALTAITACSGTPESERIAQNDDGKICRYEKVTGSHIGTRICRTPEQIEKEKQDAQEALRTLQRGRTNNTN
ncbi:hypothetical protein [Thalassotalea mangrovi]|uniref:Uncharacterized protein n=1 Tax=Thalassotalea mangrovi TaxID=2572245 RepID=A0A4U1B3R2_9GAMM|nr:hypothetical protein [Thalassotalea mangrovi]TKB44676.1 hypothetical protein E8M12_11095 [Thalassotalea mangrovi]